MHLGKEKQDGCHDFLATSRTYLELHLVYKPFIPFMMEHMIILGIVIKQSLFDTIFLLSTLFWFFGPVIANVCQILIICDIRCKAHNDRHGINGNHNSFNR